MNILFVGMYPDEYSPYRNVFFQNLIYAMADAGVKCTVISPVPITKYKKNIKIVKRHRIDTTSNGFIVNVYHPRYISLSSKHFGPFNTGVLSEKLFQKCAIREAKRLYGKYDAVYGHFFLSGGLAAIKIGRIFNIPTFIANGECSYETEVINLYRELKKEEICGLSGIIAVSTNNKNILNSKKIFENIPMIVAPNSVNMSMFYKRDKINCREQLGLPKEMFIVGFIGGFIERKGDKRLLDAINDTNDIYGAFAGKGDNPPSGEKVVFCEAIKHEQIPIFLNAIDVFCLPTQNEGSCNAIIEAASCGIPVISSDLPFNDDLLTDENSLRINPNEIIEIRNAILAVKHDEILRHTLGQKIFDSSRKFSIIERQKRIEMFISRILENYYDKK